MTDAERRERFERALHYGGDTHSVDDVVRLVREGKAQFWGNDDGCIVTEVEEFPLKRVVRFWLISGELKACLALEHEILPWALEMGCTMAVACGRKGWQRAAAPTGWLPQPHAFNFYKKLSP